MAHYPGSVSSASKMYIPTTFFGIPLYGPEMGACYEKGVSACFLVYGPHPIPLTARHEGQ